MLKALRRKTTCYLEGNNDPNDYKFLTRNHEGQNEMEQPATRMYKDLTQLNNREKPIKRKKIFEHLFLKKPNKHPKITRKYALHENMLLMQVKTTIRHYYKAFGMANINKHNTTKS